MAKLRYEVLAEKLQLKRYFYMEYTTLSLVGFDCNSPDNIFYRPKLTLISVLLLIIIMLSSAHYSYMHIQDLDLLIESQAQLVQAIMAASKCYILFRKRREIVNLMQQIWEITENASETELKIIRKANKRVTILNLIYCLSIMITISSAPNQPLTSALAYISKGEFEYKTLIAGSFPIKTDNLLNYSIINIGCLYGACFISSLIIGVDMVFSWSTHNIAALFQVLQCKLESLSIYEKKDDEIEDCPKKLIVDCIKNHQQILALAKVLNQVFRPVSFTEFSMNSIQICFIVYQLVHGYKSFRMVFLVSFLTYVIFQMLLYSYGGQRIQDKSSQVAVTAFHNIQWQRWSPKECKMLLLMTLRSQRPCMMTGIFFNVNMSLFLMVLQTAGSYTTLLQSIRAH